MAIKDGFDHSDDAPVIKADAPPPSDAILEDGVILRKDMPDLPDSLQYKSVNAVFTNRRVVINTKKTVFEYLTFISLHNSLKRKQYEKHHCQNHPAHRRNQNPENV